jgi:hypothetical protein
MNYNRDILAIQLCLPDNPTHVDIDVNNTLAEMYMMGNLKVTYDLSDLDGKYIRFEYLGLN